MQRGREKELKGEEEKKSVGREPVYSSAICVRVCVLKGGASVLTDTGSSWVVQGLDTHTHTLPILCTNKRNPHAIVVAPPTPSLVFAAARQESQAHSRVHESAPPAHNGNLSNWDLLSADSNDLIKTTVA